MYFCYLVIISPWKRVWPLLEQTRIPFIQGCFVLSLLKNCPMVLEKIFGFSQCIFAISQLSPLGKGHGPLFEQTTGGISFTQECFVPSLVEIGLMVLEKKVLNFISVFPLFHNYPPWKRPWPFNWINLNPLHQRMLWAKFGRYWPSDSWQEDENAKKFTDRRTEKR